MDGDWREREAEYFRRIEARLVPVEMKAENNARRLDKLEPVVAKLRDADLIAATVAERMNVERRAAISRLTVAAALLAVFVPPILTALLVHYIGTG